MRLQRSLPRCWRNQIILLVVVLACAVCACASAYNARPKLVVIIVIDQFRGDYLERYHDQFGDGGFKLFLDRGAYFTDCNYDYANTRTAPGHATLLTGSYTSGHGIVANEWWDPQKKKRVTSVEDDTTKLVGIEPDVRAAQTELGRGVSHDTPGASPHNLMGDTLGDELKLATGGKARVFAVSLKDRAAVLPAGFSGDGAYWIDAKSGDWITSTYYRPDLPDWVRNFNAPQPGEGRAKKYWNREWKDSDGTTLGSTAPRNSNSKDGVPAGFYEVVGSTPFANDYQFEFARELVLYEKLGAGPSTDLLVISLSANDILGHQVGPDSPQMRGMALALDRQLAEFFDFLRHQIGMASVWMALSADHGVAPLPDFAKTLRLPAANLDTKALREQINFLLSKKYSKKADYVVDLDYPLAWLNEEAYNGLLAADSASKKESDAETDAGEAMKQVGLAGYFTKSQLARGDTPATEIGRRYAHSYSPEGGWYVIGIPRPFQVGSAHGTDHATPFSYDTHVPLAFYGLAFQPGVYRTHAEPVDLAVTLASLLGINAPAQATGRVLIEALAPPHHSTASPTPSSNDPSYPPPTSHPAPAGGTQ
jgi:predicted AlkP superfamily pyrophosphatase or phosphodiesterase